MKRRRVFAGVSGVLLAASIVAAPQASAAACSWVANDLPLPAGVTHGQTTGSSGDNRFIVGSYFQNGTRGVLWDHGALRTMTLPSNSADDITPRDVNNSGVVVGAYWYSWGADSRYRPFRYSNGTYEFLYSDVNEDAIARGVNENGDVIGEVWLRSAPQTRWVAMWPAGQPRRLYLKGQAIGISNDRKLVVVTNTTAWLIDGHNGKWTEIPGGRTPMVFDNERVLHMAWGGENGAAYRIVERDVNGVLTAEYNAGLEPFGRTSGGTLFGSTGPNGTSLWQNGWRTDVDSEKDPHPSYYGDATDGGALIATYRDAQGNTYPARWFWTCT
ncbi:hypothetical protein LFM09_08125 [Lentzea alba]|uniref:hypothetical protein n=1 Tax=Lentzea alba TaxID=2714351 RepID=UPI0039BFFA04